MNGVYGTPDIRITVTEIQGSGKAPCGYQPGDSWLVTDLRAPEGLCTWAIASIAPYLATLRFGGSVPWEDDKDRVVACCSDATNPCSNCEGSRPPSPMMYKDAPEEFLFLMAKAGEFGANLRGLLDRKEAKGEWQCAR